jgi:hypothetical protein
MTIERKTRGYFTGGGLPRGVAYKRFRAMNKPDERTFQHVFNSILMPSEVDDAAKPDFSGHSRQATNEEVMLRTVLWGDGHTRFVKPSQIPIGEKSITSNVEGNFELENDEVTPGISEYYGTNEAGEKGYHSLAIIPVVYFIDVPLGSCQTRAYTDGNRKREKALIIPKEYLEIGKRIIWTCYYCASTFDIDTEIEFGIYWQSRIILDQGDIWRGEMWRSDDEAYPPKGTVVDPYDTLCKSILVIDILEGNILINAYNEYHHHGDNEMLPNRSCCYTGKVTSPLLNENLILSFEYKFNEGNNTFQYNRSEVEIIRTNIISTMP